MRIWQKLLAAALAAALLYGAVAGQGSMGGMICMYGLLTMGAALLYQRFLTHRDENDFDME